jgi:phosphoribosylamine--glycine ligase
VRFGDPEAQAVVRRFQDDLLPYLAATARGTLAEMDPPEWDPRFVVGVVGASDGYPGAYRKGDAITGTQAADEGEEVVTFHAGTAGGGDELFTSGGRVLCVTALGEDIEAARERAYEAFDRIEWSGKFCRRDIGTRVEARKERISAMLEKAAGPPAAGQLIAEPGLATPETGAGRRDSPRQALDRTGKGA